ncbi:hypothetical protein CAL12_03560 [Bordetella genomosp. 8]|uniref:Uncharacterized protein n=1 Tax=Bordetella genomosp. 8 TaxID=1416806 RepID=A0A1W6YG15_9BORD|nr:hypothetical protein [Bordetella genomosp. 8]ARP79991.1 hypothetical protein CAL12_03560 [Bordetella genomosp. 8]
MSIDISPHGQRAVPDRASAWQLAEVWSDTVDLRHLAWSIGIGVVISVAAFIAAGRWLGGIAASAELAHAYAMLAGLAGSVIAGVVCARLFPPKREVVEDTSLADPAWRAEVLAELAGEPGGLGTLADLPPAALRELRELGLLELFDGQPEPRDARLPRTKEALA